MTKDIVYPFDRDYLSRLRDGHLATWNHFIDYFNQRLTIKLLHRGLSREATQEVILETFVRVLEKLRSPDSTLSAYSLGAFVFGVCNNCLFERARSVAQVVAVSERNHNNYVADSSLRLHINQEPWRWSEYLLYLVLPTEERDSVPGDLIEEYRTTILPKFGIRLARIWFMKQVLSSIWPFLKRRIIKLISAAAILRFLR
jgi:hypothetical protein